MKKLLYKPYHIALSLCIFTIIGLTYYYFFSAFSTSNKTVYLYIDDNDDVDSVINKAKQIGSQHGMDGLTTLIRHSSYSKNILTGRYAIKPSDGAFQVFRHIKNGMQEPVSLTIPTVRTIDKLAGVLGNKLMLDSTTIIHALQNADTCRQYGYDTLTISCMFIPNTYDVYWNTSLEKLLKKMQKESDKFWNDERKNKARQMGLSPVEVITLASIVDEETANDAEKPVIAGMYYNRLMLRNAEYPNGMPLQADPTIKFATKQFDLKRIYNNMLRIKSPYNTYIQTGLPPGPIRIPTVAGIDAVLNYTKHNYLYMCAKESLNGTHNFAVTYQEHLKNAQRYAEALNQRNIK